MGRTDPRLHRDGDGEDEDRAPPRPIPQLRDVWGG